MPIRRLDTAAGLTVTYRVVNDETGAEVIASTAAVVDMGGLRYSTATSIPAGQSVEWSIGGVYSFTTDPLADNAGIAEAKNNSASAAQSATLIHGTDIPALAGAVSGNTAAIAAAAAQLYAAGAGSVSIGTPITSEALVERGTDATLVFAADTTGRSSTLTLYPQGSTTAALTVAGTARGATTAVALTDAQTLALSGVYRMVLDSTLGADTVRHIDGLLVAT